MSKIVRMTLFKLSDNSVVQEAIQKYSSLTQDAVKVRSCHLHVRHPITSRLHSQRPASRSACLRLMIPAAAGGLMLNAMDCGVCSDEAASCRYLSIVCLCRKHVREYNIIRKSREYDTGMHGLCTLETGVANGLDRTVDRTFSKRLLISRTTIPGVKATRLWQGRCSTRRRTWTTTITSARHMRLSNLSSSPR